MGNPIKNLLKRLICIDDTVDEVVEIEETKNVVLTPSNDDDCMCHSGCSGYCHKHHTTWI